MEVLSAQVMDVNGQIKTTGGGSGGGTWPEPGKLMIGTTEYATVSAACAAAGAGDLIKVGEGTFTADAVDVPSGVDMLGSGREVTVIQTTSNVECLNFQGSNVVMNLSVKNTYDNAASNYAVRCEGANCTFRNVYAYVSNASGSGYPWFTNSDNMILEDCQGLGTGYGAGTYICIYNFGGTGHTIRDGKFDGDDADIDSGGGTGAFYLKGPHFVNNLVATVTVGGTYTGWYFDDNLEIRHFDDVYTLENDAALGFRLDSFLAWEEHFDGLSALPAGWAWAGAPFVTPTVSYQGSYLELSHAAAARSFLYKTHDGSTDTAPYTVMLATNSNSTTSYAGPRLDDGTDNNYAEGLVQIAAAGWTGDVARQVGGGGRTQNTGLTFYHPIACITLNCYNTRWTAWDLNCMIRGINTAGLWIMRTVTVAPSLGWTPSRQGIVINWQGAGWHRWYIDAWLGD